MLDRGHLTTESASPGSRRFGACSVHEAFDLISAGDATVAAAVARAKHDICRAIELVVDAFRSGGRLIYVGAGTSGRLGVLDAAECPPTFRSDPATVVGIIAGGDAALRRGVEGAEDRPEDGAARLGELGAGSRDVVFGISTGGTTPYVHAAMRAARDRGARTVFLACVPADQARDDADVSIRVITGPEIIAGSTRMKAGTATKMVLNMVTTIAMARTGRVYENLMVDVDTSTSAKLVDRGIRIVRTVLDLPRAEAVALLQCAGGAVKIALVMGHADVDRATAGRMLARAEGHVGRVLDDPPHVAEHRP